MSCVAIAKGPGKECMTPYRHKRSRDMAIPSSSATTESLLQQGKKVRKTSIIASPVVFRGSDFSQQSQMADGSQLECYEYTPSRSRSQ